MNKIRTDSGMERNQNMNVRGGMTMNNETLREKIRALCFVKKELELYLDTHPDCPTALDYFYRTMTELNKLTEEYENSVGPLTSGGVVSTERWTWVNQPWPWQREGDYIQPREEK